MRFLRPLELGIVFGGRSLLNAAIHGDPVGIVCLQPGQAVGFNPWAKETGLKLVAGADGGGNGHGGSTPEADMRDAEAKLGTADQNAGLRRNMTSNGLWLTSPASIVTQQDMLFRTMLTLPSNVPAGDYSVRILHFRDGVALSERITDMNIRKSGMSALIYSFAHDYPVFYGLFAIAFAVASGWLTAVAFRRG